MRRKILPGEQFLSLDGGTVVGTCLGDLGESGVAVKGSDEVSFIVPRSLITVTVLYSIPYSPGDTSYSDGLSDVPQSVDAADPIEADKPEVIARDHAPGKRRK